MVHLPDQSRFQRANQNLRAETQGCPPWAGLSDALGVSLRTPALRAAGEAQAEHQNNSKW